MDRTDSVEAVQSKFIQAGRAIVFFAFLSVLGPVVAQAQPTVLYDGPVSRSEPHPCIPGEVVTFEGRSLITSYARFDGAGGSHFTLRFVTKAEGTGVTSPLAPKKNYKLNEESIQELNMPANSTSEETFVLNHVVIRQAETDSDTDVLIGTSDDYMLKDTVHITTHGGVPVLTFTPAPARCM